MEFPWEFSFRPKEKLYYVKTSIVAVGHIQLVLRCGLQYKHNIKTHVPACRRDDAELLAEMVGMNL